MSKPFIVDKPAQLLAYLFEVMPEVKKTKVRNWLKYQSVLVNGRPITHFDHELKSGDEVTIRSDRFAAPKTVLPNGMKIYFEDATVIVIEKPANLLSIASDAEQERTAYYQLTKYLRKGNPMAKDRVWIVHRLDRETSGLMVFTKDEEAKHKLQGEWEKTEKIYEAVIEGHLPKDEGTFESDLDERKPFKVYVSPRCEWTRHAVTHYRVLATSKRLSLVQLALETGRRHQIRVQLSHAGCPIIGDEKYGSKGDPARRLGLHACALSFVHPVTGKELRFTSPLPKVLADLVPVHGKSDASSDMKVS